MAKTRSKSNKGFRFLKFCEGFFMWLFGIVISAVPVFLKHLKIFLIDESISGYNFLEEALGDFEFSFVSVSVLFILCLEELLLRDKVSGLHRAFRVCSLICLVVTGAIYCVSFFIRDQLLRTFPITQFGYNMLTLCLTVGLGVECHIGISSRKGEATC